MTENNAILNYAVEEEHTYLSPPVKPHNVSNVLMCTPLLDLFGFTLSLVYTSCEMLKSVFSEIYSS